MKPNQRLIDAEIALLEELKPKVRRYTAFGDDNRAAIQTQIETLRGDIDTTADEFLEMSERDQDMALEAQRWLDGEEDEAPSVGWKELAQ